MLNLHPSMGILVRIGFVFVCYLKRKNNEKLTAFWKKSMLFKRELRPTEKLLRSKGSFYFLSP
uniref:NADH dehydrogenase [ubiquinone] 1 beta subcomplex subunit 1 n=1 Tax=Piliocolobus tephrosceles TaxID=591936 RepID=A0A8C9GHG7_9PRIM